MCVMMVVRAVGKFYMKIMWITIIVCLLDMSIISGGEGVRIKEITVPDKMQNGTDEPAILDCDYALEVPASKSGLVVKWFFNNHPAPVYQWIYNKKPQYLGVLKGKVNLDYRATNDESTMYRGFQILTPTIELSGEYKCLVSTFDKEDSRSKKMIIYVPENVIDMRQDSGPDRVSINCTVEGVYPEPNMTIKALNSKAKGYSQITTRKQTNSSLYDIRGSLTIEDEQVDEGTQFVCEFSLPDVPHYNKTEALVYFSGPPTTPFLYDIVAGALPTSGVSSTATPSLCILLVSLLLMNFISNP